MTRSLRNPEKRHAPEEIHARLIFIIGVTMSVVFALSVMTMLYALVFVTQPVTAQAPNDKAFIDQISVLTTFLTGALGGVLASNGLKSRKKEEPPS
jgi:hypothetical protein